MVDGLDVSAKPNEVRARLGVVPETVGTYDRFTVREHVTYSGELQGSPVADADRANRALLEQLGLAPLPPVTPADCPSANGAALHWRERWFMNPAISCSTNRPMGSMS